MKKTVVLSDGLPCEVRSLRLFELDDHVKLDVLGPYTYTVKMGSETHEAIYDGREWEEPPQKPDIPENEIEPGSEAFFQLREYRLYNAWIEHEDRRIQDLARYCREIRNYIIDNCLEAEDAERIYDDGDWLRIHRAAMVPRVGEEEVAEVLRDTFPGYV